MTVLSTTSTPEPTETVIADETSEATGSGEEVVPISPIAPVVNLASSVSCTDSGTYTGLLTIESDVANATITDILAFHSQDGPLFSVMIDVQLPVVLEPGTVSWPWQPETSTEAAPVALLVRIDELPGTENANAVADDDRGGWLLATVEGSADCALPTPTSTATEPVPDATPSPDHDIPSTPTVEVPTTPTPPSESDSPVAPADAIVVSAMDSRVAAIPGQTVDQHFLVRNTSDVAMTVHLTAISSSPTWTVELFAEDGVSLIDQPIVIDAHDAHEVIVRFSVPPDAFAGDRSTIALDVQSDVFES